MTNKQLASTVLEYRRRGSQTTRPISSAPKELQDLWNRGNEEGISMIKVRKYKERYETKDGTSFRVHNYGKVSLNESYLNILEQDMLKMKLDSMRKLKWVKRILL